MDRYEEYIKKLKDRHAVTDFSRMHSGIDLRLAGGAAVLQRTGISLAGALVLLAIAFVIYFNGAAGFLNRENNFSSYVFQQESMDKDPVMDYVFQ